MAGPYSVIPAEWKGHSVNRNGVGTVCYCYADDGGAEARLIADLLNRHTTQWIVPKDINKPDNFPPRQGKSIFSEQVWLALSNGLVLSGRFCYYRTGYEWFAYDGDSSVQSTVWAQRGILLVAWAPFSVPAHPHVRNSTAG